MKNTIEKASKWAKNVWTQAVQSWEERSQDHNYRDLVARPGIYAALKSIEPKVNDGKFLDIGCAEGAETFFIRDALIELGHSGTIYGYDPQQDFIDTAIALNKKDSAIPTIFGNHSIDEFLEEHQLANSVDVLTSIFVLQDLPDIHAYLNNVDRALKMEHGVGIFTLVHPDFGEMMKTKGAAKIQESLAPDDASLPWRFVAEYPIVEEHGKTFFVPYFHRTIEDYKKYFSKYFSKIDIIGLQPSKDVIGLSEQEHRSPFYNHHGNLYYPEIVENVSCAVIIAKR